MIQARRGRILGVDVRRLVIAACVPLAVVAAGVGVAQAGGSARRAASPSPPLAQVHPLLPAHWLRVALARQTKQAARALLAPRRLKLQAPTLQLAPYGGSCYVGASRCSLTPCDEFVGAGAGAAAAVGAGAGAAARLYPSPVGPAVAIPAPAPGSAPAPGPIKRSCLNPAQDARPTSGVQLPRAGTTPIGLQTVTAVAMR